ncbi:hypothetical protein [Corynebacterium tuberculostearicum]|nr:hypothetical protein [Corynebacterium tuberculostearicum]MDV2421047.1 hypothetical protein [Corynebacterium tuberculostearicum]WKE50384.1 hypothetical protein J8244_09660 [Corynebacterium tuberculostearicum]
MPSATRSRAALFHHCQKDDDTSVYASFTSPNNERWTDRLTVEGQPY